MRRSALALLGLLALPLSAVGQSGMLTTEDPPERLPQTRFAVTPYVGVRVPYTSGRYIVFGGESGSQTAVQEERGGASAVGLNLEARLRGPLSFLVGGSFSGRETYIFALDDVSGGDDDGGVDAIRLQAQGPAIWFAKAGIAYRLPDPSPDTRRFHPSAFVSLAPAIVWVDWEEVDGVEDDLTRSSRHFGVNLAADATSRIAQSNFAVNLGLEGMVTFWDFDALRVRDETIFADRFQEPVVVDYDYSASTILFLRLGASYRF
ncbi:MAG TPA: hypothetical protein VFX98_03540 [Longimicrobiaceae bacterium]|nr:hypothetical protein [Longimicrobiaceae bacterium]